MKKYSIDVKTIAKSIHMSVSYVQKKAKREAWPYSRQRIKGANAYIFKLEDLPSQVRSKVTLYLIQTGVLSPSELKAPEPPKAGRSYHPDELWDWFEGLPENTKKTGEKRASACFEVHRLLKEGHKITAALDQVAADFNVSPRTIKRWWYGSSDSSIIGAAHVAHGDLVAAVTPNYTAPRNKADISPDAWTYIKNEWLRASQPKVAPIYRRAQLMAAEHGWVLPSKKTIERRLKTVIPWDVALYAREGEKALERRLPHIKRLKANIHALEIVNADGHVFDVLVKLPSGKVGRPVLVAWQDVYSSKILSYRVSETLNQHVVRLSFGDLVETYGIPHHAILDNGREFANKWMSGGSETRFRWKIREDEPDGIFKMLGIMPHWTLPYHGQSKPIERAWLDLIEGIAKHPACEGAYTGNSPTNKPANYGERAMEWEAFLSVVEQGIAEYNARSGRRGETANGRSFNETFAESYERSTISKATPAQRRLWLLAAEGVMVDKQKGHISISGNAYWGHEVSAFAGCKVVVRFDPENLLKPVHVYSLKGGYIGEAAIHTANFLDAQAKKDHNRANRQRLKATKEALNAERTMSAIELAQQLPNVVAPIERPKAGIIAPVFQANKLALEPEEEQKETNKPIKEEYEKNFNDSIQNWMDDFKKRRVI